MEKASGNIAKGMPRSSSREGDDCSLPVPHATEFGNPFLPRCYTRKTIIAIDPFLSTYVGWTYAEFGAAA